MTTNLKRSIHYQIAHYIHVEKPTIFALARDGEDAIMKVRNLTGKYLWKIKDFKPLKSKEIFKSEPCLAKEVSNTAIFKDDRLGTFVDSILNGHTCKNV